jgi:hypothetical protein
MKTAALKAMITRITQDTGLLVVKADQEGAKQPSLPYAVYKVTSPYIKGRGRGNIAYGGDEASSFETLTTQPIETISFNIFADDGDEAREKAVELHHWFIFTGTEYLEASEIAVRRMDNVENRTTHIVDHYEYKHGFDVQLRTVEVLTKAIHTIETVTLQEGN